MIGLVLWILFGGVVGWLASIIMHTDGEQGAIANVLIGVAGAILGGFLWHVLTGDRADSMIGQLIVAVIGAVIVIAVWRAIRAVA